MSKKHDFSNNTLTALAATVRRGMRRDGAAADRVAKAEQRQTVDKWATIIEMVTEYGDLVYGVDSGKNGQGRGGVGGAIFDSLKDTGDIVPECQWLTKKDRFETDAEADTREWASLRDNRLKPAANVVVALKNYHGSFVPGFAADWLNDNRDALGTVDLKRLPSAVDRVLSPVEAVEDDETAETAGTVETVETVAVPAHEQVLALLSECTVAELQDIAMRALDAAELAELADVADTATPAQLTLTTSAIYNEAG